MKKVVIDVDTGVDDAWGLFLFLAASIKNQIKILGVTCTKGNAALDHVLRNTQYLLATAGFDQVPVFKGAAKGLVELEGPVSVDLKHYFGVNGFGDVRLASIKLPQVQEENGIVAMNRLVAENKGEVTLVCFAPLTTVALAVRCYPDFVSNVKEVYVMGGNYTAHGNTTMSAEFNFHADPEAAQIVLSSFETKLTLLPWETCYNQKTPYNWRKSEFPNGCNVVIDLLNKIEAPVMERGQRLNFKYYTSCDSLLAAIVIDPSIACDKFDAHAIVELSGYHTRGQIVIDHLHQRSHNISIVRNINLECFQNLMLTLKEFDPTEVSNVTFIEV